MKMFSIALVSLFAATAAFADMPPGALGLPIRGIVVCVNGVMQGLVIALEEIRKKKEAAGG